MTTVTAVRRALEEASQDTGMNLRGQIAIEKLTRNPTALTILANRLSDTGTAGNAARDRNLATLRTMYETGVIQAGQENVLQWAIDQLTPPQPATVHPVQASHKGTYPVDEIRVERITGGMPVCAECGGWGEHMSRCSKNPHRTEG